LITCILKEEGNAVDGHCKARESHREKKCLKITLSQNKATTKMTFIKTKYQWGKVSVA